MKLKKLAVLFILVGVVSGCSSRAPEIKPCSLGFSASSDCGKKVPVNW